MGRRKPRKDGPNSINIYRTAMKTESSTSSAAECGTENIECTLHDHTWDMSQGNCTCDQNICLLNSLKLPKRDDESTNVGADASRKPVQAVRPLPVRRSARHLNPPVHDPPSPDFHPSASTGEEQYTRSPARSVKRQLESSRGYNLRPRKCTCMGSEEHSCHSDTAMDSAEKAESTMKLEQSVGVLRTGETVRIKTEKNCDIQCENGNVKKSEGVNQQLPTTAFVKENYPSEQMGQEEFLKNCDLVKARSRVFVKQEVEPVELDLECQIVSVESLRVFPRISPNTRSLISSLKRESSVTHKAKKSLMCGLGICNGEDSDNSSDSGMPENAVKRSVRRSLLCIALSSPLGQRVKKFTKADLVKAPVSDIEQFCISIPEEDELRLRLRQKEPYPVKFKRRKNMVIDYSYTYKFYQARRQWHIWRVCRPQEFQPCSQAERYKIKKCLVRLTRMDEKQVRLKTLRKKTILNREVTIDNDLSIVRMDVPEQLYDEIQKMQMTEGSSPRKPGTDVESEPESVTPVPGPSGITGTTSTGIRKSLPRHRRPCPKSKRKRQQAQEDLSENVVVESVLSSSEEDEPAKKLRVKEEAPPSESEDVQIISVTNISSPSIVIDLSDTEEQESGTDSKPSCDGSLASAAVRQSESAQNEEPPVTTARPNSTSVDVTGTVTVSTAGADTRDSSTPPLPSLPALPTLPLSLNAESASTSCNTPPVSQDAEPTSDRGVHGVDLTPDLTAQSQPASGAQTSPTVPGAGQAMNTPSVSQSGAVAQGQVVSSGTDVAASEASGVRDGSLLSTVSPSTGQAQGDPHSHPGAQSVSVTQSPAVVQNVCDGASPVTVTTSNMPAVPGSSSAVPTWPVTVSPAHCVSVMSSPSCVQTVPLPIVSSRPHTAPTLQASAAQGQVITGGNEPTRGQGLPPPVSPATSPDAGTAGGQSVPCLTSTSSMQSVTSTQSLVLAAESVTTSSFPVLPNPPPLVTAAGVPVVPASPTLTPNTSAVPQTPPSNTASLQTNLCTQDELCVSSANIQTAPSVTAVSSVQSTPPLPHSTSPQNTLQEPSTPLSPNAVGAQGVSVQTIPGRAQSVEMLGSAPLLETQPPVLQISVTRTPSQSGQISLPQGTSTATNVVHTQSVDQISDMRTSSAVQSSVQSNTGVVNLEQRPTVPQPLLAGHTSVSQTSPSTQGNIQTSMPQNTAFVQGNTPTSLPQNSPVVPGNIQTSLPQNSPVVPGNIQTSLPQNSPVVPGNIQTSLPQNSPVVPGNIQTSLPQNSPVVQGNVQTSVPQNFSYVQGNIQTYVPQNSFAQGYVQTSMPQNSPFVQGNLQTSMPQNYPFVAGTNQTSMPQNSPFVPGSNQTSVPQNSPFVAGTNQTSVPQNSQFVPGSNQTSVPQNFPFVQGNIPVSVPQNISFGQCSVATSVPQNVQAVVPQSPSGTQGNSSIVQGSVQTPLTQNSPYVPGNVQTPVPQNSVYIPANVQTSVPQNASSIQGSDPLSVPQNSLSVQGHVQTSVPQNSPYKQGNIQTSVPQNSPYTHGTVQPFMPQNSAHMPGSNQMFVPNNAFYPQSSIQAPAPQNFNNVQGNAQQTSVPQNFPGGGQAAMAQHPPQMQGNFQTSVPQHSSFVPGNVQTSMPQIFQMQGNTQTPVPPISPQMQGNIQTSMSQNSQMLGNIQTPMPQHFPQGQGNFQTSMPQSSQVQGNVPTSVPQHFPQIQGNTQTSVPHNSHIHGNIQTSVPQNFPYIPGSGQTSVPQNSSNVPSNIQTSVPQNSPYVQGSAQMSVPQNSPHVQDNIQMSSQPNSLFVPGNVQTSMPQNSYVQGNTQMSVPQNVPHAQGNMQTSVPQNSLQGQGNMQTPVPQNSLQGQGNMQTSVPQNSLQGQGNMQTPVPQNSLQGQGNMQTSVPQNSLQGQGNVQTSVPQNYLQGQGNVQTPVPQNYLQGQGNMQTSVPQNSLQGQGNVQTPVPQNSLQGQGNMQTSVPQNSLQGQGNVQTSVPQNSPYVQGNLQTAVPQMFPNVQQGNAQTSVPQNSFAPGNIQTPSLQQPSQGTGQTSTPQPSLQAQMNIQTPVPQNVHSVQGSIQMPTSYNASATQGTLQTNVPQAAGFAQGGVQTCVSPNSGYVQGTVQSTVPQLSYSVQGNVQTCVPQNVQIPSQGLLSVSQSAPNTPALTIPSQSSTSLQPQGSSGMSQSNQRPVQMSSYGETATQSGGVYPPAGQPQGNAGMCVLQGNPGQTLPCGEPAGQGMAMSAQASPFQTAPESQSVFAGSTVNSQTPSPMPNNQGQNTTALGNMSSVQNNPPVSVSNAQFNPSLLQNNPSSISMNTSQLQTNPGSIPNLQMNMSQSQTNPPVSIANTQMNTSQLQNASPVSVSNTQCSAPVQSANSCAASGFAVQSSAPVQAVAPLPSGGSVQNVGTAATGQVTQPGSVPPGTEPSSAIVIDEESPEVLKQKLSVFNLIPNRTPTPSPSKQTTAESSPNVPSTPTSEGNNSQLRISAVYGAAELASMFELASSSLSVSTPSTQPAGMTTDGQQTLATVGTVTEESGPQIQIGAVYGASELANTQLAASLGLERPRAPQPNMARGAGVPPPRFQPPYNAGYRTRQPRFDYRTQQNYGAPNRQRFAHPQTYAVPPRPQRYGAVPRQQNFYRGRGAPCGGGQPVRYGRGAPAPPRGPSTGQFVPQAGGEDDDCVEVICLDDD